MDKNSYCVIMAGGQGTRLWPMSRKAFPKQFQDPMGCGKTLLQQTREECTEAMHTLSQYLLPKQQEALARYMDECLSYITDHTSTRRKVRSDKIEQYFYDDITSYRKQSALRLIKQAVLEEHNAAAALALEVKRLQRDGIMRPDIRPLTQFIAIVNATFGSNIKHDTFSKHFR